MQQYRRRRSVSHVRVFVILCAALIIIFGGGLVAGNAFHVGPFSPQNSESATTDLDSGTAVTSSIGTAAAPLIAQSTARASQLVRQSDPNAPRIYLTFDDGPSTVSTPQILDILDRYGIKATFFMMGTQAEANPAIVRQINASGHVIANHSYSHNYDHLYSSPESFMQDIEHCEEVLTSILGKQPPRIVRFPGGSSTGYLDNNPAMRTSIKEALAAGGWRYFDWNASIGDSIFGGGPAPGVLASDLTAWIDEQVATGTTDIVVLCHDTNSRPWTPTDLPTVIEYCQQQGYVFEVITSDTPTVAHR